MNAQLFKNLLRKFADPGSDLLIENDKIMVQVNDSLYSCSIEMKNNEVYIKEDSGNLLPSINWILKNLAKIDILANRIQNILTTDKAYVYPNLLCEEEYISCDLSNYLNFTSFIRDRSKLNTGVVYLTSDAGEGKTSFVNELSLYHAQLYNSGQSDFIVVPISLGGRTFHRFDDIVMGALANKFRFPFLNYDAFIELIKLKVIVPALDGFEEMFVETGTGEALSAMGILLNSMDSSGSIIVSARKAYYEFENLSIQPKLFDIIRNLDVAFYKIEIERWDKVKFITFLEKSEVPSPNSVYNQITEILPTDHAIITRPVLAKKFVDLIKSHDLNQILNKLFEAGNSFFASLVDSIIQREANEKWLEKSGTDAIFRPLISVSDHYELLSLLANEMWLQKKDYLKNEMVSLIVELYAETLKFTSETTRQIKERLKGHALLRLSKNDLKAVEFDHEEFKDYFLSNYISKLIVNLLKTGTFKNELITILRKGLLRDNVRNMLPQFVSKFSLEFHAFETLNEIAILDGINSYTHENVTDIVIKLLPFLNVTSEKVDLNRYNFGLNSLTGKKFRELNFHHCNFSSLNLEATELYHVSFTDCNFENLKLADTTVFKETTFLNCTFISIEIHGKKLYEPNRIHEILISLSLIETNESTINYNSDFETDSEIVALEKLMRYFLRSTHISDSVIRMKLGSQISKTFFDDTLPRLLEKRVFVEIENKGSGNQKRYKLGFDMSYLDSLIEGSFGHFEIFLQTIPNIKSE